MLYLHALYFSALLFILSTVIKENEQTFKQCWCNCSSLKEGEDQKEISVEPAQALDEVEPLPEDCYSRAVSLPEGTVLFKSNTFYASHCGLSWTCAPPHPLSDHAAPEAPAARHPACRSLSAPPTAQTPPDEALPSLPGQDYSKLLLLCNNQKSYFVIKLICRGFADPQKCEHNLSKPEFNPTSIKFKIQLVAVWVFKSARLRHLEESLYWAVY